MYRVTVGVVRVTVSVRVRVEAAAVDQYFPSSTENVSFHLVSVNGWTPGNRLMTVLVRDASSPYRGLDGAIQMTLCNSYS